MVYRSPTPWLDGLWANQSTDLQRKVILNYTASTLTLRRQCSNDRDVWQESARLPDGGQHNQATHEKLRMKLREDIVPQQLHVVFVRELVDLGKAPLRCRHSLIERNQLLAADA
jgi:hypothetical protein